MTFITVIRSDTFPSESVEVELDGTFIGNLTGNVVDSTCITFVSGQGIKIGNIITSSTTDTSISIGKGSVSTATGTIAIGEEASATATDSISIGRPETTPGLSGTATAEVWGQVFQNRAWDDNTSNIAGINGTGDIFKTTINVSDIGNLANVTTRCITGTRSGAGNVTLSTSPTIPTDEVWGFTIDVVGRETGSGNIFYERQSILAFNDSGTVGTTTLTTISSYGIGSLSSDTVIVEGNSNAVDVVVTTSATGTTNWTGKLNITTVS